MGFSWPCETVKCIKLKSKRGEPASAAPSGFSLHKDEPEPAAAEEKGCCVAAWAPSLSKNPRRMITG
jgi:hypothetical protein